MKHQARLLFYCGKIIAVTMGIQFLLLAKIYAYSNPQLKVLLFKTSQGVVLQSSTPMRINNIVLNEKEQYRFLVNKLDSRRLIVNNWAVREGSIWVYSSGKPIRIQGRGYEGAVELKPYAKGLYVINHLPVEKYLKGVINAEINTKWPFEAVKAQTIIARTYALYQKNKRGKNAWHLSSDFQDQVYLGVDIADKKTEEAVQQTKGLIVTHENRLVPTFYHSNCGGITEDSGNLWQYALPHLKSKVSPFGKSDPAFHWEVTLNPQELKRILDKGGITLNYVEDVFISKRTTSNRALALTFVGNDVKTLSAPDFRKLAGYGLIRSLLFEINRTYSGFSFNGSGSGHGVGFCQWGAKDMATQGKNYREILNFYFTDIQIQKYNG